MQKASWIVPSCRCCFVAVVVVDFVVEECAHKKKEKREEYELEYVVYHKFNAVSMRLPFSCTFVLIKDAKYFSNLLFLNLAS